MREPGAERIAAFPRVMGAARIVAVVLTTATVACAPRMGAPGDASGLRAADAARMAAMVEGDPERLEALLDDDLTYTHSNGRVDSKESLVAALVSGRVDYRTMAPSDTRARVLGSAGVVTGAARIEVVAGGRVHRIDGRYTATYAWRDGRWRLVAYHSSPIE